jgi:hypothetical protein
MATDRFTLSKPSRPESVGLLGRERVVYAGDIRGDEAACQAVALAVSEALINGSSTPVPTEHQAS